MRLVDALRPPAREAEPREMLLWVRRMEVAAGVSLIAAGAAMVGQVWWGWLMIGLGLLSLSGWGGVRTILRKAESRPEILEVDPERRRTRLRRFAAFQVSLFTVAGIVTGYLLDGAGLAVFMGSFFGTSAGLGAWWSTRRWG